MCMRALLSSVPWNDKMPWLPATARPYVPFRSQTNHPQKPLQTAARWSLLECLHNIMQKAWQASINIVKHFHVFTASNPGDDPACGQSCLNTKRPRMHLETNKHGL